MRAIITLGEGVSMKKVLLSLLLVLGLGMGYSRAVGSFEGIVNYQISFKNGKQMDMEYLIKGNKFRTNMSHEGNDMSTIMDMGKKTATTLMHKQKMYMTHTLDKAMTSAGKHQASGKFYKASGAKTILGRSCEHWIYEGNTGKTDMWLASGLGVFMGWNQGGSGKVAVDDWVKSVKGRGLFPMEIDSMGKEGKTMTMLVTNLEEKSLSSDLFEVPAGYKKMPSFEDMGKKMKSPSGEDLLKGMKPKLPF
jgi:hypothetical protein